MIYGKLNLSQYMLNDPGENILESWHRENKFICFQIKWVNFLRE